MGADNQAPRSPLRCVIVTGTHRSGTSLMASVLRELGIFMGENFNPADPHNPRGYWEDNDFRDRNQEIIGPWYDPRPRFDPSDQIYFQRYIRERFEDHRLWGAKDVRFCWTLPIFARALQVENPIIYNLKLIVMERDHVASARSIHRCFPSIRIGHAKEIVELYHLALQDAMGYAQGCLGRRMKTWVAPFDRFFVEGYEVVEAAARFVGIEAGEEQIRTAAALVCPEDRHF